MTKNRFNHVEPRDGQEPSSGGAAKPFQRKTEKASGFAGFLAKFRFLRKVERPGQARERDPVEIPKLPPEEKTQEVEKPLEVETPPAWSRAEAKAKMDPARFDKTKSQLEKMAGDLHRVTDRSLPKIKVEEDPVARRQREAADRFYNEEVAPNQNQKPSVAGALGKILGGGFVLFIFFLPAMPQWILNKIPGPAIVPLLICSALLMLYMRFPRIGGRRRW